MSTENIIISNLVLIPVSELNQEGKNSSVIIAHDCHLNSDFVVKSVERPQNDNLRDNWDRYFQEARMIYSASHPNIVKVQYSSFDNDKIYMAMPFYKKGSLNTIMNNRFLTAREIIAISLDVLTGLAHIHSKHILHLDIKPTNVLFADNGNAVITDFGQSSYMNGLGMPIDFKGMYWLNYSPERFAYNTLDYRTDIYDVGLLIYRMCIGNDRFHEQEPHNDFDRKKLIDAILKGDFPNRNIDVPHIPKTLINIVKKALALNPDDRYNDCIEFMNALSKIDDSVLLDMQYTLNESIHRWEYTKCETIYHAEYNEETNELLAYKYKNKKLNITKLCKQNISKKEAFKLIKKEF